MELPIKKRKHLGKKESGIRGAQAPGQRIDWVFLGRLAFGPSPIGALGLGRLDRGTESGLMVPTKIIEYDLDSRSDST